MLFPGISNFTVGILDPSNLILSLLTLGMNGFTLELLTPFDLEALRCKDKYPSGRQNLGDRRYLLLVQTDGFNRIHYPLSLPVEIQPEFMNTVPDFPDLVPNKAGDTKEIHTIVKQLQVQIRVDWLANFGSLIYGSWTKR